MTQTHDHLNSCWKKAFNKNKRFPSWQKQLTWAIKEHPQSEKENLWKTESDRRWTGKFCQLLSKPIPIMHSFTGKITPGGSQSTERWAWAKTIDQVTSINPSTACWATFTDAGSLGLSSEPVSSNPQSVCLFPFPQYIVTLVKDCRSH